MPMKISGNAKSATMRCRSRSSLMKSRWASARMAEASVTGAAHDLEVRVLEARRMRLRHAERRLDAPQDRVHGLAIELDFEGSASARRVAEARELVPQGRSVCRVDEHVLLDEIALDVIGCSERDHLALVDDADPIGLFRLLQVVRRQEDGRPARPPDLGEVLPERAAGRDVQAGRRLLAEEDPGAVQV